MRLSRLTTRRLMVTVAVVAVSLGAQRLFARRFRFRVQAEVCADRADDFVRGMVCLRDEYDEPRMYEKLHARWMAMARKYRDAATHPRQFVPPDPPLPSRADLQSPRSLHPFERPLPPR